MDYPHTHTQGTDHTILSCMVMEAGNKQRTDLTTGSEREEWIWSSTKAVTLTCSYLNADKVSWESSKTHWDHDCH